jgi:glucan-binding YG repeat protein
MKTINKRNKNKHTRKNKSKGRKKYGAKITDLEIKKCDNMCNTTYLEYQKKFFKDNGRTNQEIDNRIKQNKENYVKACKDIFCNPKCSENRTLRYVCPVCKKREKQSKKYGAITFCKHTSVFP